MLLCASIPCVNTAPVHLIHPMATGKKSFILYAELIHSVDIMTDEQAGKLFRHILEYVNDRDPHTEDQLLRLTFEPIKWRLKDDLNKWRAICDRNSENGKRGGRPRKTEETQNNPVGFLETQNNPDEPKKADNDTDTDIEESKRVVPKPKRRQEIIPTHPLTKWIATNTPTIQSLKEPLTDAQAEQLIADLNINTDIKRVRLKDVLTSMENKPDLLKKYKSANLTIRKWWKIETDRNPITEFQQPKRDTTKPHYR